MFYFSQQLIEITSLLFFTYNLLVYQIPFSSTIVNCSYLQFSQQCMSLYGLVDIVVYITLTLRYTVQAKLALLLVWQLQYVCSALRQLCKLCRTAESWHVHEQTNSFNQPLSKYLIEQILVTAEFQT